MQGICYIHHDQRLGNQWWHRRLKMATTVKGREIRSAGTKTVWDNGMGLRLTHNKIGDFGAVSET